MITAIDVKFQTVREIANLVRGFIIGRYHESGGMCVDATRYIADLLTRRGIEVKCYEGHVRFKAEDSQNIEGYHVWLEVDGVIVDVTADQFDTETVRFPAILIGTHVEYPQFQDGHEVEFNADLMRRVGKSSRKAIKVGPMEFALG